MHVTYLSLVSDGLLLFLFLPLGIGLETLILSSIFHLLRWLWCRACGVLLRFSRLAS